MSALEAGAGGMTVPILMYHEIVPESVPGFEKYVVTPRAFARQMGLLDRLGYAAITPDALVAARQDGIPLPSRPVVITFDDGFAACARYAAPILGKHGFTAAFYLVAGSVGAVAAWPGLGARRALPLMSWAEARAMQAEGFTIGSHTVSHPHLSQLSPKAQLEELSSSRRMLEDGLGTAVEHLAYPFGAYDEASRQAATQAGYRSAVSVRPGLSGPDDDLFALRRINVEGADDLAAFLFRLYGHRAPRELWRDARHRLGRFTPAGSGG